MKAGPEFLLSVASPGRIERFNDLRSVFRTLTTVLGFYMEGTKARVKGICIASAPGQAVVLLIIILGLVVQSHWCQGNTTWGWE